MDKPIIDVLNGASRTPPPVWLMRQAGRYLPEYRALREKAGGFLDLVFNSELAAEVTLQPMRRFGFDAAILFSDILVVPHALGQTVTFAAGEGPLLDPIKDRTDFERLTLGASIMPFWRRSMKRSGGSRRHCRRPVALLGFCGAPWTVATYMIAGRGTPDQAPARMFAYRDAAAFDVLMDVLVEASASYLVRQLQAGADAVQIFDTWAGVLPPEQFARWCIAPTKRIVTMVRLQVPGAKIIGFPRGAGTQLPRYVAETGVDAAGLDWMIDKRFCARARAKRVPVQGNLDPLVLLAGGVALDRAVDAVLGGLRRRAVHLQSRPRHPAGNADRPRGADAQACSRHLTSRARAALTRRHGASRSTITAVAWRSNRSRDLCRIADGAGAVAPIRALPLAQGAARHRGDLLDGRDALSAAAVRLSLRGGAGLETVRDLQGDGAPVAHGDHQSGDGRDLGAWSLARLGFGLCTMRAGCRPSSHWCVAMSAMHGMFVRYVRDFANDRNQHSQRFYRIINEVPTLLMIGIVILVVVKPF